MIRRLSIYKMQYKRWIIKCRDFSYKHLYVIMSDVFERNHEARRSTQSSQFCQQLKSEKISVSLVDLVRTSGS